MTTHRLGRVAAATPLLAFVLALGASPMAGAQQPAAQPPPIPIAPYRAPAIALVQPPGGGTVPQDRPVVVFRFALGEPDDPLDITSFRVAVDGVDESGRFQVAATEAWGAIGAAASGESAGDGISAGAHQMVARICSARGACSETSATITVVPSAVRTQERAPTSSRKARVLDALLTAVKKILLQP